MGNNDEPGSSNGDQVKVEEESGGKDKDTAGSSTGAKSVEDAAERRRRMDALLNRKRRVQEPSKSSVSAQDSPGPKTAAPEPEDEERKAKAREKLLFEAKRARQRADEMGPQGWLRPKSLATNKNFLSRTLQSTLSRKNKG